MSVVEVVDPVFRTPQQESTDSGTVRALEGRTDVRQIREDIDGLIELIQKQVGRCLAMSYPPAIDVPELMLGLVNEDDSSHRLDRSSAITSAAER